MRPQGEGSQIENSNGDITYRSRQRKEKSVEHSKRYEGTQEGRQRFNKEGIVNGDKQNSK